MQGYISVDFNLAPGKNAQTIGLSILDWIDDAWKSDNTIAARRLTGSSISFSKSYTYSFDFPRHQKIAFQLIGSGLTFLPVETNLATIVLTSAATTFPVNHQKPDGTIEKLGKIKVSSEMKKVGKDKSIEVRMSIKKSDKIKKMMKTHMPEVFFEIGKKLEKKKDFETIFRSVVIDDMERKFKRFKTTLSELYDMSEKTKLKITIFAIDENQEKKLHEIKIPVKSLETKDSFSITENGAQIVIETMKSKISSFSTLTTSDISLKMHAIIDYGYNNGLIQTKGSSHHLSNSSLNINQYCLKTLGNVISQYSRGQTIDLYGYGALLDGQRSVTNGFSLDRFRSVDSFQCGNVEKALEVYGKATREANLYGPKLLGPAIEKVLGNIKSSGSGNNIGRICDVLIFIHHLHYIWWVR